MDDKLCDAIYQDNYKQAIDLINSGYSLNEKMCGLTSLMWAIPNNDYICKLLIKKGYNLNLQNHSGLTALLYCSYYNNKSIMLKILKRKPFVCLKTQFNDTFFSYTINKNQHYGLKYYYLSCLK